MPLRRATAFPVMSAGAIIGPFDWHQFEKGRIRFSGGTPGNDRTGYETFGVELPSGRYFGEVEQRFGDPTGHSFNLVVPAFGARSKDDVGGLGGATWLIQSELDLVIKLLPRLADAVAALDDKQKPFVMGGQYLGRVFFESSWAKVRDER